jgi:hypothetical protein
MFDFNFLPWREEDEKIKKQGRLKIIVYFFIGIIFLLMIVAFTYALLRQERGGQPKQVSLHSSLQGDHRSPWQSSSSTLHNKNCELCNKTKHCLGRNYFAHEFKKVGSLIAGLNQSCIFLLSPKKEVIRVRVGDFLGKECLKIKTVETF